MRLLKLILILILAFVFYSCDSNNAPNIDAPEFYEFTRNGESTVSFTGQTTRIQMAAELTSAMLDFDNATEASLLQMYRNETEDGGDANPFENADLNAATKNIKGKVAASADFFSSNTQLSAEIKNQFEAWIIAQTEEVFPNEDSLAAVGKPGQIADGSSTRYVNAKGLEYNQLVSKSLIGALMTDQMLNNYLSTSVLDAGTNREDNSNGTLAEDANYTNMEHKWDEAYGYLFGTAADLANPIPTVGEDDDFLNKYLGRVDGDEDFNGIAQETFDAFKLGRAAIEDGAYDIRDEQAQIIRENISTVIAVRAVYYLQSAKTFLDQPEPLYGAIFHDLSEAYGFIYSLKFTRIPNTDTRHLTLQEIEDMLTNLEAGQGLWDIESSTLDQMSETIAAQFEFTVEEAAN
jgi:ATP-dependent protease HslVU (ClpYQ) peptidase subunit